jgi:DNA-binding transcriptional LysR family regulator
MLASSLPIILLLEPLRRNYRNPRPDLSIFALMENFRLKVFRVVADKLNFTQAADTLYLTQPAVTLQIKALEDELCVRLFNRSGARISLTPAGETLLRYAKQIQALSTEAEREIGLLGGEERGRLALGASTTIAQYLLPRLAGEFAAASPRVELSILGANTERIVAALADESIEIGLIEGPAGRSDFKTESFIDDELAVIVPPGHDWLVSTPVPAASLTDAPLILRERGSGTRRVVEDALKRTGIKLRSLRVVMELDSTEAIKSAVEAGLGVGIVSYWALTKERQLGTLGIVQVQDLRMTRQFKFIYRHGPEPDGPAGSFLRFARQYKRTMHKPVS